MEATRVIDWKARLDAYVARNRTVPFDWAGHNCASFAAGWVHEATGRAIALPATPDAQAAARAADERGGLEAAAREQLGEPISGRLARAGDVVLVALQPGAVRRPRRALGVCLGATVTAPGDYGLQQVPITQAEAAWRV